ncbi:Hsp70 ATPase ssc1 [Ceratobasidium sp. 428]|nr:Hsp70 ATPase ssc1 [Ceratobasidium sp. 428]
MIHGIFQFLFGAGLIGQLVLGAIYAVPLGNILPFDVQTSIGVVGYIGLIMLIVEGGLDARLDILSERRNLCICLLVAWSGIGLPIGLSMLTLHFGYRYSLLESFIVGAALSATSLGTTFAIMASFRFPAPHPDNHALNELNQPREESNASSKQVGLGSTRAGTILIGAAILDDIVGLVISSVVSNLGPTRSSNISGWVIARPIVSSIILLLVTTILARFVCPILINLLVTPTQLLRIRSGWATQAPNLMLFVFILIVSAYVTIAHYAGSSMLIGAFCAGALMKYCWELLKVRYDSSRAEDWSPHRAFERMAPVQNNVLAPFFFASIGAAIPVRTLFRATTAWRGILYSALMVFAKIAAAAWLPIWSIVERRSEGTVVSHQSAPSWPAGLFVGLALVTRGEIGLLILNLAESKGSVTEEAFGVGIWAVVLNTLIGPIGVGRLLQTKMAEWVIGGPWGMN